MAQNQQSRLRVFLDGDLVYSFKRSPLAIAATLATLACFAVAALAPLIAPHCIEPVCLDLMNGLTPPAWTESGVPAFPLGTDEQGRDILSSIFYASRVSLVVGFAAVGFGMVLGVGLGIVAGYFGGWVDAVIMRLADMQLTFPSILVALLIAGVVRSVLTDLADRAILTGVAFEDVAIFVLIVAIGLSDWPRFARVARGATLVELNKGYVAAAKVLGLPARRIMLRHVLPNLMGPILVIATIGLALAIIAEATLSFLGVGVPPTNPSLGTLIRIGNEYLFSGEWWITLFPALWLILLVLSVNIIGDWLRDALNPKLRR
ncbi:MAG: ABC transporter permease [Alphaproteobacteria bacterium]|nr:ABC transporter permease [Alphaproteobacteria bacterium]MCB9928128.1 ABC transporter permease [Alphaproteobacteria bacterium]